MFLLLSILLALGAGQESGRLILSFIMSNQVRVSGDQTLPLVLSYYIPGESVPIGQVLLEVNRPNSFM